MLLVLVSAAALAQDRNIQGTVSRIDEKEKTLVVREGESGESTVFWTESTQVSGDLQEGAKVEVVAADAEGKLTAKSIRVLAGKDDLP
jgi:hypothetical protein